MSALRVALRLSRRDALRARGRSALVVAMIAIPVLGVSATDVLYRSLQLSPDQKATRLMGRADGLLTDSGEAHVTQLPEVAGISWSSTGDAPRKGPGPAYLSMLPRGSRVVPVDQDEGATRVSFGAATTGVVALATDLADPITTGMYVHRVGRPARTSAELVVTTGLADRLGLHLHDQVVLSLSSGTTKRTVVGIVTDPGGLAARTVILPPGSLPRTGSSRALVDVPGSLTWSDVRRANAMGFLLQPRGRVPGQPQVPSQVTAAISKATVTAASLVVGMALLEVVLLAGPAFAVGAKRRTRELALLAATGAERRDVTRTVLGGGVVVGAVGAVLGVTGGLALVVLGRSPLERFNGALFGSLDVRPLELGLIALTGMLTAVLAAVVPARVASRQDVVAGLTGRRGSVRSLKRVPVLGVIAAAGGAALALYGATGRHVNLILAGSAVAELGLVATTPFLVGLAGRAGRVLPLAPRLALRDAARNRGRTAPAVSAILAAVAGSVAVATVVASLDKRDRDQYSPQAPYGTTWVTTMGQPSSVTAAAAAAMRQHLPGATVTEVRGLWGQDRSAEVLSKSCDLRGPADDAACFGFSGTGPFYGALVGDASLLRTVTGASGAELARAQAVLARGGAVVPPDAVRPDGTTVLVVQTSDPNAPPAGRRVQVPAVADLDGPVEPLLLSPAAAARIGVTPVPVGVIASAGQPPSGGEEDRLRGALRQLDLDGQLFVERGYQSRYGIGLLALLLGSAVIVLGASSIATGLAAADGRADLATLAAVGASPRTRRVLAASQSAATAGLGTVLGVVSGMVPAIAILRAMTNTIAVVDGHAVKRAVLPLVIPWTNIGVTLLVVPVLAALAAAALTRSRLPMVRRLG